MEIACLDLEGVLVPEIWLEFAKITGIEELKATTREIADYDVLMKQRLRLLDEHGLGLAQMQAVAADLRPMEGAKDFIDWMNERFQVVRGLCHDSTLPCPRFLLAAFGRTLLHFLPDFGKRFKTNTGFPLAVGRFKGHGELEGVQAD